MADEFKGGDEEYEQAAEAAGPLAAAASSNQATLVSMGFDSQTVCVALAATADDPRRALDLLLRRTAAAATACFGAFCVGARVRVLLPTESRLGTIATHGDSSDGSCGQPTFEVLLDGGGEACVAAAAMRPLEAFELEADSSAGGVAGEGRGDDAAAMLAAALEQKDFGAALFKLRDWGGALRRYKRALKALRGIMGDAPTVGASVIVRPDGRAPSCTRRQYAAAVVSEVADCGSRCDLIYDEPDEDGGDEEEGVDMRRLTLAHAPTSSGGGGSGGGGGSSSGGGHGAIQCTLYLNAVRCALRQADARQEEGPGGEEAKLARLTARRYAQVAVALALRLAELGGAGGAAAGSGSGIDAVAEQQRLGTALFLRAKSGLAVRRFRAAEEDAIASARVLKACAAAATQLEAAAPASVDVAAAVAAKKKATAEAKSAAKLAKEAVRLAKEAARSGKELAREVAMWVSKATDAAGGAHTVGAEGYSGDDGGGAAAGGGGAAADDGPWTCPMCTFEHGGTPPQCEICGHSRRGAIATAGESGGGLGGFLSSAFGSVFGS
jgi:rubrerythrin